MNNVPETVNLYNNINSSLLKILGYSDSPIELIVTDIEIDWNKKLSSIETIPDSYKNTLNPTKNETSSESQYKLFVQPIMHDEVQHFKSLVFMTPKPKRILPPIVSATVSKKFKDEKERVCYVLKVNSFIIVPTDKSKSEKEIANDLNVSLKLAWDGMIFAPKFLLSTEFPDTTMDASWVALQVAFAVKVPVKPAYITAYLWDVDPEGSRGTETTVQDDDDNDDG